MSVYIYNGELKIVTEVKGGSCDIYIVLANLTHTYVGPNIDKYVNVENNLNILLTESHIEVKSGSISIATNYDHTTYEKMKAGFQDKVVAEQAVGKKTRRKTSKKPSKKTSKKPVRKTSKRKTTKK